MAGIFDKSKRILVCGAYGLGNSGDEAILQAILERIRGFDPDAEITVISRTPEITSKRFRVKSIASFDVRSIRIVMKNSDILLFGGGSLLQDVTSTRSLYYYLWILKTAKKLACKVLIYGCGIGPINKTKNRILTAKILNNYVDEITVRDKDSFDALTEIGVTIPPIHLAADLALSLKKCEEYVIDNIFRYFDVDLKACYACFCLKDWYGINEKIPEIKESAIRCYYEHGLIPLFLLLNPKEDQAITDKITEELNIPYAVINKELDSNLLIGVISRMKVIISVRLHALVFAAGQNVPFVAINYDPKIDSFASYMQNENCIDIKDISSLNIMNCISNVIALRNKLELQENAKTLKNNELENYNLLTKYLGQQKINRGNLLRIAFCLPDLSMGSISQSLINIFKHLDFSSAKVDVYYNNDKTYYEKPNHPNLNFIKIKAPSKFSMYIPFCLYRYLRAPYVNATPYDVIVDFDGTQNQSALNALCMPAGKHVMWVHDDVSLKRRYDVNYDLKWLFFSGKFKYFDEFVTVSERIINGFKYATHLPNAKITAIPSYVDTKEIMDKSYQVLNTKVDPAKYNLCAMGELCRKKGFDIMIEKFASAYKQRQDLMLYIIGNGPEIKDLRKLRDKLGVKDAVVFTGLLYNPFPLVKQMDGFISCSRYEGQGIAVKEAQSLGLKIFLNRNLENYNEGIDVCNDLVESLVNAQKDKKIYADLRIYNMDISQKLEGIFG